MWSSRNTDIIKIDVIWENGNGNTGNSTVEWYETEIIIDIMECMDPYYVTVVEHNKCQDSFPSNITSVNGCSTHPPPPSLETGKC